MTTPFDRRLLWMHWKGEAVVEGSIEALTNNIRQAAPNVAGVVLKTSDGTDWEGRYDSKAALAVNGPDDIRRWVDTLAARGLETHLWCVARGSDISAEAERIIEACGVPGVKSMLLAVNADEFDGKTAVHARRLITRIRAGIHPEFHLGLNFDARGGHPASIHIQEWLPYVQSLHPMVFHWEFGGGAHGPEPFLDDAFGTLARYGLPVVPMLQTYPQPLSISEAQVFTASEYAFAKGAVGLTYFRYGGDSSTGLITAGIRQVEVRRESPSKIPARRVFQVRAECLRVRSAPGIASDTLGLVANGVLIDALPDSRTEADGYIWWQSVQGWLAQGRIDNRQVLMVDLTPGVPPYGQVLLDPLPADPNAEPPVNRPVVPHKRFRVVTRTLSVRSQPELDSDYLLPDVQLDRGTEIIVDADGWTEKDGFIWWFVGPGWCVEKALYSHLVLLHDLTPDIPRVEPPPVDEPVRDPSLLVAPTPEIPIKRFRVVAHQLNVRSEPGLARRAVTMALKAGEEVLVRADAWKEMDRYVWWQHGSGWSAERSLDGRQRFMEDMTPTVPRINPTVPKPTPAPTPPPVPVPGSTEPQRYQIVALGLTVRAEPSASGQRLGSLPQGTELLLSPAAADRKEADGFIWRRHEHGWSAERTLDNKHEYMLNVDALPLLGQLVQRMPVRISETDWVQYYGNTSFAYRYGKRNSYDKFSQGLHSGLDFGKFTSNPTNPPIFTGVDGLWDGRGKKYGPNRIDVLADPYRIVYGHIGKPANIPRRQPVGSDTVVGVIENTQIHLHFEIRYKGLYIVNPLLMMPPSMADEFMDKFPPKETEFVQTGSWKRFLSPLDQPIIRLGGEVIGPTA